MTTIRLEYALLADAADVARSGKIALVGGNIETVTAGSLPAAILGFTLVAFLAIPESEAGSEHKLSLTIQDPRGENLVDSSRMISFTPQPNPHGLPVRYVAIVNLGGLAVFAHGLHTIHLVVDGEDVGTTMFVVVPAAANEAREGNHGEEKQ